MPKALGKLISPFASLRLTVVLLTLSIALIFFGTLAQRTRGIWWVMDQYFTSWIVQVPLEIFVFADRTIPGSFPFPGGATLGLLVLINLLAAHSVRFRLKARGLRLVIGLIVLLIGAGIITWFQSWGVIAPLKASIGVMGMLLVGLLAYMPALIGAWMLFGKRFGIVLIHLSLILLIAGEGVTRVTALETQMPIYVGQTINWTHDIREAELIVVAPRSADDTTERIIAFPQSMIEQAAVTGRPLSHPDMPFDLVVEQWMINSVLAPFREGFTPPPGFVGIGRTHALVARPEASGVGDQLINLPGAVVSIRHHDHSHGRYALSTFTMVMGDLYRFVRQDVPMHGQTWQIDLRFRRYYQPYSFELLAFHHDTYPGTQIPLNYASDIRIRNDETGEDREVHIRMNQPLRYEGQTFFQSGYIQNPSGGADLGTVLQVVANPGSTMPYIACALGGIGLLVHFVLSLFKYARRSDIPRGTPAPLTDDQHTASPKAPGGGAMKRLAIPTVITLLAVAWVLGSLARTPKPYEGFDLHTFGQVPVSYGGRYQPIDTVARNSLIVLSGRQTLAVDARELGVFEGIWYRMMRKPNGKTVPALAWLLDVKTRPDVAEGYPLLRVDHPEVRGLFGQDGSAAKRFSYRQIAPAREAIDPITRQALAVDRAQRSTFQHQLLRLASDLNLYEGIRAHALIRNIPLPAMDDWASYADTLEIARLTGLSSDTFDQYRKVYHAWHTQDAAAFNTHAAALLTSFKAEEPAHARKAAVEARLNIVAPFGKAMALYVIAALLIMISWLAMPTTLRNSAMGLVIVGLIIHTVALVVRVYLSGRPPVTNLYSSAVFVGWGVVAMSLLMELILKRGLGLIVGCVIGFSTLLIAQGLSADGDTLAVLQAVLDTNFWLATHVIVITVGYVAVFVAGGLGALYVLMGVFTTALDKATSRGINGAIYGTTCVAILFSFVGTILGGIWADQSWGRFWGWDPKENGALMIVLWCAILLHARWGGLVRGRGLAVLAIFGNVVCAWSWFGTNMLGAGLHSYGFTDAAFTAMLGFLTTQAVLIAIGTLPMEAWRSREALMAAPTTAS